MRDGQGMTFAAIGAVLAKEGVLGSRGATLGAKGVFDIYKKRKAHILSHTQPIQYRVTHITIYSRLGGTRTPIYRERAII